MKFRILFALFNFVVIVAFALIIVMPAFVLGWEYTQVFWQSNWPVAIVFVAVLGVLNTYFGLNWRLFTLLEREDWPELINHLEGKILGEGRPGRQKIRLLINAYVITGASEKITALESRLRDRSPEWVYRFPLEFGIPYVLRQDPAEMARYFSEMKDRPNCPEPIWVRWNYAFALLLGRDPDGARPILTSLAAEARNPVQLLLTAYLLDTIAADDEATSALVEQLRTSLRARYPGNKWERAVERERTGIQALVLSKLIDEASRWVFGRDAPDE